MEARCWVASTEGRREGYEPRDIVHLEAEELRIQILPGAARKATALPTVWFLA